MSPLYVFATKMRKSPAKKYKMYVAIFCRIFIFHKNSSNSIPIYAKVFELENTEKVILLVSKFSDIQTISARRSDRDRSHARYTDCIGKFIRDLR